MAKGIRNWLVLLALTAVAFGCGVKAPPRPSSEMAPPVVTGIKAMPKAAGMEVSFGVPQTERPAQRVVKVVLFYGYLPLTGDPACPPCPPRLRRHRDFDLTGPAAELMDGGRFLYLDKAAPMGKEAIYQVVLEDASGRLSKPSALARAPRVMPPKAPANFKTVPGDGAVALSWQSQALVAKDADGLAGFVVFRTGPDGAKQLIARPLRGSSLNDRTVVNGQAYAYKVAAVERIKGVLVYGSYTGEISVTPKDAAGPKPPSDLMAVPVDAGYMLRFTPSPDQDTAGYVIFRARSAKGPWQRANEGLVMENTFVDRGADPKKKYYYRAQAVDEAGNLSEFSEVLTAMPEPE